MKKPFLTLLTIFRKLKVNIMTSKELNEKYELIDSLIDCTGNMFCKYRRLGLMRTVIISVLNGKSFCYIQNVDLEQIVLHKDKLNWIPIESE